MNDTTNTNERLVVEVELVALALSTEACVRTRELESYAHVAELGHVTRARITQIVNLVNLATDIIEELLFLPRIETGRARILLRDLQPLTRDWMKTEPRACRAVPPLCVSGPRVACCLSQFPGPFVSAVAPASSLRDSLPDRYCSSPPSFIILRRNWPLLSSLDTLSRCSK
jgi:hypothetical protein